MIEPLGDPVNRHYEPSLFDRDGEAISSMDSSRTFPREMVDQN